MKILSLFYFIAFFVYLIFSLCMLFLYKSEKQKSSLYIIFLILCLFLSFASFNYAFLVSSKIQKQCWFWFKLTIPSLALFPPLLLDFFFGITKVRRFKFKWLIFFNYLFGSVFLIKGLTGRFTIDSFVQKKYGWEGVHSVGYFWYSAYTIYYISNLLLCIILILFWFFKTKSMREKKQSEIMLISSLITTFINIVLQTVLPALKIYLIPKAPFVIMMIFISGILYAMVKYRFMIPTLQLSSMEIISNIDEMVLILDTNLNIIQVNNKFLDTLNFKENEVINKSIYDFIFKDNIVKDNFALLVEGNQKEKLLCRISYKKDLKEEVITDTYMSKIKDRFSDFVGLLLISSENKGIETFQKIYKITKRELEIIELALLGCSNFDISEKLKISERTVETHLSNIYNKIGINNKIELFSIANDFNLIKSARLKE